MRITNLPSGALQANTYLAVDEKTKDSSWIRAVTIKF